MKTCYYLAGRLQERLQQEISYLAENHQGPVFEPHVTLLPGFEAASDEAAVEAAKKLADRLKVSQPNMSTSTQIMSSLNSKENISDDSAGRR